MKKIAITSIFVFAIGAASLFAQFTNTLPANEPKELYAAVNLKAFPSPKKTNPAYMQKHIALRPLVDKEANIEKRITLISEIKIGTFPNPFSADLNVNIKEASGPDAVYEACLFDLQGRKVFSQGLVAKNEKLNTNSIAPGIYILNVQRNGITILQEKVIKQ